MLFRITSHEADGVRTLQVSGRLVSAGAEELERACGGAASLRLDVSQLLSADEDGTNLLVKLCDSGARLLGAPPYIRLLLDTRRRNA